MNLFWLLAALGLIDTILIAIGQMTGVNACLIGNEGCDVVLSSSYSKIFGIPLSTIGISFYSVIFLLSGQIKDPEVRDDSVKLLFFLSLFAFIASLGLVGIQKFILHAFCPNCLFSSFLVVLLLLLSIYYVRRSNVHFLPVLPRKFPVSYASLFLVLSLPTLIYFLHGSFSSDSKGVNRIVLSMEGQQISYQDMRYALGIPLHRKEQEVYGEEMEIYEMGKRWLEDQIFDQEARQSGVDTLRYSKRRSHHLKELKKKLGVRLDLDRPKPMEPVYTPVAIPSRKGTIEPGKARIVVFSDFTCPHCQEAHSLIKKTLSPFSDFIHLEKRHVSWSSKGKKAASAAFCAELQGKYDAYADLLFKNPNDLDQDSFLQHAETIGLDLSKFERCFESEPAKEIVKENMRLAQRIGLRGLPTFIVNSYFITGWQEEAFLDLLKREMDDSVKGN